MKATKLERKAAHATREELVFDLVCGMELLRQDVRHITHYNGATYYFCSSHCKLHLDDAPLRYIGEE